MFVLHCYLTVKSGEELPMEETFLGPFSSAIKAQEGFVAVALLKPNDGGDYLLSISFETHALQQTWVATDLHNEVWSMMESRFAGWSAKLYTAV